MNTADEFVRVSNTPGGPYFVVVGGGSLPEVRFGPEANPANATATAEQLKLVLRALLERAANTTA